MRRLLAGSIAALVLGGIALSAGTAAQAQNNAIIPMLICPFGCGNAEGYAILGNLMARGSEPVTLAPQETPGYMYNVRAMAEERRWKNTVFGTEDTIVLLAPRGGEEAYCRRVRPRWASASRGSCRAASDRASLTTSTSSRMR